MLLVFSCISFTWKTLYKIGYNNNTNQISAAEINICAQCQGAWLTSEQFAALIRELLKEAHGKSASEYTKICLQTAMEMVTNPGSIMTEWQEFKTVLDLLRHRIFIDHPKLRQLMDGLQKSMPL
jgi:hypothetical protein